MSLTWKHYLIGGLAISAGAGVIGKILHDNASDDRNIIIDNTNKDIGIDTENNDLLKEINNNTQFANEPAIKTVVETNDDLLDLQKYASIWAKSNVDGQFEDIGNNVIIADNGNILITDNTDFINTDPFVKIQYNTDDDTEKEGYMKLGTSTSDHGDYTIYGKITSDNKLAVNTFNINKLISSMIAENDALDDLQTAINDQIEIINEAQEKETLSYEQKLQEQENAFSYGTNEFNSMKVQNKKYIQILTDLLTDLEKKNINQAELLEEYKGKNTEDIMTKYTSGNIPLEKLGNELGLDFNGIAFKDIGTGESEDGARYITLGSGIGKAAYNNIKTDSDITAIDNWYDIRNSLGDLKDNGEKRLFMTINHPGTGGFMLTLTYEKGTEDYRISTINPISDKEYDMFAQKIFSPSIFAS